MIAHQGRSGGRRRSARRRAVLRAHEVSVHKHIDASNSSSRHIRHIGPSAAERDAMLRSHRRAVARRPHRPDDSARHPAAGAARPARRRNRARLPPPAARRSRRATRVARSYIGHGLLRLRHAERDPAERVRESRLVHAVHAVSGRDRPGPSRIAAEFPDGGQRPDRHGHRDGVAARRGHGGGRSDDDVPSAAGEEDRHGHGSVFLVSRALLSADARRAARPRRAARHPHRGRRSVERVRRAARERVRRCCCSIPDDRGEVVRPASG